MLGDKFLGKQYLPHRSGEYRRHTLLDIRCLPVLRMPSEGLAMHDLRVGGKDAAGLPAGNGVFLILRETYQLVELHNGQTPFLGQLAHRSIEKRTAIVPVRTQYDDGRLPVRRTVVTRLGIEAKIIALRNITLYHIVVAGRIVRVVEGQAIVDGLGCQGYEMERSIGIACDELCRIAAQRAANLVEYRELLEGWGVDTQFRRGRMYVTDTDNARYSFSVTKLDASLNPEGLERAFRNNAASGGANGAARVETIRTEYLSGIRDAYLAYRRQAQSMEGTTLSKFPKLKLHRPPEEIAGDPEVRRTILAYWRGADELRVKLASDVPYTRRQEKHGETAAGTTSAGRSVQHEARGKKQER